MLVQLKEDDDNSVDASDEDVDSPDTDSDLSDEENDKDLEEVISCHYVIIYNLLVNYRIYK